jgi:cation diffusion facilitator CzcD-associated flavoprotein CzcO
MTNGAPEHLDVIVVGAGLSGIGAAWHLQQRLPGLSYLILEGRDAIGGTWDLFRYPGVRSDSDMYTMGYRFRTWQGGPAIADGRSIKTYIENTARESGIDERIRFGHRVVRAKWSSETCQWTVETEVGPEGRPATFTCGFLYTCTGYYRYDTGHAPEWPGMDRFAGDIVHPQHWPEDLDHSGRDVVVIGSGATAVTLVPALATGSGSARHVTMLQRSPTYIASMPSHDRIAETLGRFLPTKAVYALSRWRRIVFGMLSFKLARSRPEFMKHLLMRGVRHELGPYFDVATHFTPRYDPWDQRLCLAPDGDFFAALRDGRASIVTDHIERFTETGIDLRSGEHLDADLIVSATGLEILVLGGIELVVDGDPVDLSETLTYKGMMYSDVPNLVSTFGYTNASWTLKADLTAEHVCRLLDHMRRHGYDRVTPRRPSVAVEQLPALDFTSGYVQRALDRLPKQGSRAPWRVHQNYVKDLFVFRFAPVDDPALELRSAPAGHAAQYDQQAPATRQAPTG